MVPRDGFAMALRGEWTKLTTVRSTVWTLTATVGLTILICLLSASGSNTFVNDGPHSIDQFHFVHQPLTGDGSVVAQVSSQQDSNEWAKAGIMVKESLVSGSPAAVLMLTPRHGVRLQGNLTTEVQGSSSAAPRWLKLTRSGDRIAGYESGDGTSWEEIGTVDMRDLPRTAQAGLFVSSPDRQSLTQVGPGSIEVGTVPTPGRGTFAHVSIGGQPATDWSSQDVAPIRSEDTKGGGPIGGLHPSQGEGSASEAGGVFTVTGVGDIGQVGVSGVKLEGDSDLVRNSLAGIQIGLIAVVALSVLFITSEFSTGVIRTTFAVSPLRGRALAAKAVVLAGTVFVVGFVASLAGLFLSQPLWRSGGFAPPAYPHPSLADGPVLRAVVGSALFLTLIALFSLGVGALLRRTAGAIVLIVALVVVLHIVTGVLSVEASTWVNRVGPVAGLAIQQTVEMPDTAIGPWAGLGVLAAYAAVTLGAAFWMLRKRDA
ncbi:MAG TPA: hypothetical protein VFG33_11655 [Kribbella sp.]|uniref:hypothetical protein n=1 Tax=Kribbella sp. TaxID=1871183 RepID=UPI002D782290|nr:hypothetical protein [Kribbella sp.]HET6294028.1 hypothetical protein [Kribbella sp.]